LEQAKTRFASGKHVDKGSEKPLKNLLVMDDPCDDSTHWIGRMNCYEKKT
jgi:hypothetical protein